MGIDDFNKKDMYRSLVFETCGMDCVKVIGAKLLNLPWVSTFLNIGHSDPWLRASED